MQSSAICIGVGGGGGGTGSKSNDTLNDVIDPQRITKYNYKQ